MRDEKEKGTFWYCHTYVSVTYAGYDRFGRIKDQRWDDTDATADTDRYQYGYDDVWNRLVKVSDDLATVAEYEYDGLNRRIVKSLGTGTVKEHYYFNEDWQELEVRQENSGTISANPREQFVWHPYYIDALVTRFYDSDVSNSTGVVQHYFTQDANFNVTAAVDTSGNVVERYDYSPYGEPIFLDASFDFDDDNVSDIAHSRMYTGQRFDAETWLHHYRNRYLHSNLGRFISRDPIGYEGSKWSLYEYVESSPAARTDAYGLDSQDYNIPFTSLGINIMSVVGTAAWSCPEKTSQITAQLSGLTGIGGEIIEIPLGIYFSVATANLSTVDPCYHRSLRNDPLAIIEI